MSSEPKFCSGGNRHDDGGALDMMMALRLLGPTLFRFRFLC
jgi:hypothetical protein